MTAAPNEPDLPKSFDPAAIEARWYPRWEASGAFRAGDRTKPAYTIQLPPPNVTGTLHIGHAFQQSLIDCLMRYHRMRGFDANWVVGTDHAGIATQIVVERQLSALGQSRKDMGREAFVDRVWQWKAESGATIMRQMRRLGASANWDFADASGQHAGYFTMDEAMSEAVSEVFVRLYREGLIYRGFRLVNWDPKLGTAVSDLEVESEEEEGFLWEISYPLSDGSGALTVATTRPETLLGDVAVAVNPNDARYQKWVGHSLRLPLAGRDIPVIADDYVDMEFGTGCVKITPAHDVNDWAVGQRHGLAAINVLTLDAKITDDAPLAYRGLDRFVARERILEDLKAQGLLVGRKKHVLKVPRSEKTGEIVEPMLTRQWFMRMEGLAAPALKAVADGEIRFFPEQWTSTYNNWLTNIQDWCLSRQLWWGHQIPAWYDDAGNVYVARSEAEAKAQAKERGVSTALVRDPDVLDTWFSSSLVPFSSLGWPRDTEEMRRYLPSDVLVTGFDIIFFWVARMIMMTLHITKQVPFRAVYIHALIRDAEGQKMSKSKGNTLDPIDVLDGITPEALLEKSVRGLLLEAHREKAAEAVRKNFPKGISSYGADALRFTFAAQSTFATTLNFDLNRCEGYRNFCNKLWNATRFVLMNCANKPCAFAPAGESALAMPERWILSRLQRTIGIVEEAFAGYRFDLAAAAIYQFTWDEYCDWYLELAKVALQDESEAVQQPTRHVLIKVLESTLRLSHPIIPFITEELWQKVAPLLEGGLAPDALLMQQSYPALDDALLDVDAESWMARLKAQVDAVRRLRSEMSLSPAQRVPLILALDKEDERHSAGLDVPFLKVLGKLSDVSIVEDLPRDGIAPVEIVGSARLMLSIQIDRAAEVARLSREIERIEVDIEKLAPRLENPGFLSRAPAEVIAQEKAKLKQNHATLAKLRDQRARLGAPHQAMD
jgi:valyl-tRNA synthetase